MPEGTHSVKSIRSSKFELQYHDTVLNAFWTYRLFELGDYVFTVGSLIKVILIIIVTKLIIFSLSRLFNRMAEGRKMDRGRQYSFLLLMRYFIWIMAISLILHSIGIGLTFLLASSAALLVGLGLGLQRIFADFVSGILLLFDGTIEQGDILQVDNTVGVIEKINLRTTILRDREDVIVIIPNHNFTEGNVINWSHNTAITRFIIVANVSYNSDMHKVREILLACAAKHPHVITGNNLYPTTVRMAEFAQNGVIFELLFYSENMFRIESTKSDIRFLIWDSFREQGIKIPYPQLDVHLGEGGARITVPGE